MNEQTNPTLSEPAGLPQATNANPTTPFTPSGGLMTTPSLPAVDFKVDDNTSLEAIQEPYKQVSESINTIGEQASQDISARQQALIGNKYSDGNPIAYQQYYQPAISSARGSINQMALTTAWETGAKRAVKSANERLSNAKKRYSNYQNYLHTQALRRAQAAQRAAQQAAAQQAAAQQAQQSGVVGVQVPDEWLKQNGIERADFEKLDRETQQRYVRGYADSLVDRGDKNFWNDPESRKRADEAAWRAAGITDPAQQQESYKKSSPLHEIWNREDVSQAWTDAYVNSKTGIVDWTLARDNYEAKVYNSIQNFLNTNGSDEDWQKLFTDTLFEVNIPTQDSPFAKRLEAAYRVQQVALFNNTLQFDNPDDAKVTVGLLENIGIRATQNGNTITMEKPDLTNVDLDTDADEDISRLGEMLSKGTPVAATTSEPAFSKNTFATSSPITSSPIRSPFADVFDGLGTDYKKALEHFINNGAGSDRLKNTLIGMRDGVDTITISDANVVSDVLSLSKQDLTSMVKFKNENPEEFNRYLSITANSLYNPIAISDGTLLDENGKAIPAGEYVFYHTPGGQDLPAYKQIVEYLKDKPAVMVDGTWQGGFKDFADVEYLNKLIGEYMKTSFIVNSASDYYSKMLNNPQLTNSSALTQAVIWDYYNSNGFTDRNAKNMTNGYTFGGTKVYEISKKFNNLDPEQQQNFMEFLARKAGWSEFNGHEVNKANAYDLVKDGNGISDKDAAALLYMIQRDTTRADTRNAAFKAKQGYLNSDTVGRFSGGVWHGLTNTVDFFAGLGGLLAGAPATGAAISNELFKTNIDLSKIPGNNLATWGADVITGEKGLASAEADKSEEARRQRDNMMLFAGYQDANAQMDTVGAVGGMAETVAEAFLGAFAAKGAQSVGRVLMSNTARRNVPKVAAKEATEAIADDVAEDVAETATKNIATKTDDIVKAEAKVEPTAAQTANIQTASGAGTLGGKTLEDDVISLVDEITPADAKLVNVSERTLESFAKESAELTLRQRLAFNLSSAGRIGAYAAEKGEDFASTLMKYNKLNRHGKAIVTTSFNSLDKDFALKALDDLYNLTTSGHKISSDDVFQFFGTIPKHLKGSNWYRTKNSLIEQAKWSSYYTFTAPSRFTDEDWGNIFSGAGRSLNLSKATEMALNSAVQNALFTASGYAVARGGRKAYSSFANSRAVRLRDQIAKSTDTDNPKLQARLERAQRRLERVRNATIRELGVHGATPAYHQAVERAKELSSQITDDMYKVKLHSDGTVNTQEFTDVLQNKAGAPQLRINVFNSLRYDGATRLSDYRATYRGFADMTDHESNVWYQEMGDIILKNPGLSHEEIRQLQIDRTVEMTDVSREEATKFFKVIDDTFDDVTKAMEAGLIPKVDSFERRRGYIPETALTDPNEWGNGHEGFSGINSPIVGSKDSADPTKGRAVPIGFVSKYILDNQKGGIFKTRDLTINIPDGEVTVHNINPSLANPLINLNAMVNRFESAKSLKQLEDADFDSGNVLVVVSDETMDNLNKADRLDRFSEDTEYTNKYIHAVDIPNEIKAEDAAAEAKTREFLNQRKRQAIYNSKTMQAETRRLDKENFDISIAIGGIAKSRQARAKVVSAMRRQADDFGNKGKITITTSAGGIYNTAPNSPKAFVAKDGEDFAYNINLHEKRSRAYRTRMQEQGLVAEAYGDAIRIRTLAEFIQDKDKILQTLAGKTSKSAKKAIEIIRTSEPADAYVKLLSNGTTPKLVATTKDVNYRIPYSLTPPKGFDGDVYDWRSVVDKLKKERENSLYDTLMKPFSNKIEGKYSRAEYSKLCRATAKAYVSGNIYPSDVQYLAKLMGGKEAVDTFFDNTIGIKASELAELNVGMIRATATVGLHNAGVDSKQITALMDSKSPYAKYIKDLAEGDFMNSQRFLFSDQTGRQTTRATNFIDGAHRVPRVVNLSGVPVRGYFGVLTPAAQKQYKKLKEVKTGDNEFLQAILQVEKDNGKSFIITGTDGAPVGRMGDVSSKVIYIDANDMKQLSGRIKSMNGITKSLAINQAVHSAKTVEEAVNKALSIRQSYVDMLERYPDISNAIHHTAINPEKLKLTSESVGDDVAVRYAPQDVQMARVIKSKALEDFAVRKIKSQVYSDKPADEIKAGIDKFKATMKNARLVVLPEDKYLALTKVSDNVHLPIDKDINPAKPQTLKSISALKRANIDTDKPAIIVNQASPSVEADILDGYNRLISKQFGDSSKRFTDAEAVPIAFDIKKKAQLVDYWSIGTAIRNIDTHMEDIADRISSPIARIYASAKEAGIEISEHFDNFIRYSYGTIYYAEKAPAQSEFTPLRQKVKLKNSENTGIYRDAKAGITYVAKSKLDQLTNGTNRNFYNIDTARGGKVAKAKVQKQTKDFVKSSVRNRQANSNLFVDGDVYVEDRYFRMMSQFNNTNIGVDAGGKLNKIFDAFAWISNTQLAGGLGRYNAYSFNETRNALAATIFYDPRGAKEILDTWAVSKGLGNIKKYLHENYRIVNGVYEPTRLELLQLYSSISPDGRLLDDLASAIYFSPQDESKLDELVSKVRDITEEYMTRGNRVAGGFKKVNAALDAVFQDPTFKRLIPVLQLSMINTNYRRALRRSAKNLGVEPSIAMKREAMKEAIEVHEAYWNLGVVHSKNDSIISRHASRDAVRRIQGVAGIDVGKVVSGSFFAARYRANTILRLFNGLVGVANPLTWKDPRYARGRSLIATIAGLIVIAQLANQAINGENAFSRLQDKDAHSDLGVDPNNLWQLLASIDELGTIRPFGYEDVGINTLSSIMTLPNFGTRSTLHLYNMFVDYPDRVEVQSAGLAQELESLFTSPLRAVAELFTGTYYGYSVWGDGASAVDEDGNLVPYDPMKNAIAIFSHIIGLDDTNDRGEKIGGSGLLQHEYYDALMYLKTGDYGKALQTALELPMKSAPSTMGRAYASINNTVMPALKQYKAEYDRKLKDGNLSKEEKDDAYREFAKKALDQVERWNKQYRLLDERKQLLPYVQKVLIGFLADELSDKDNKIKTAYWAAGINVLGGFDKRPSETDAEYEKRRQQASLAYSRQKDKEYAARKVLADLGYEVKGYDWENYQHNKYARLDEIKAQLKSATNGEIEGYENFNKLKSDFQDEIYSLKKARNYTEAKMLEAEYLNKFDALVAPFVDKYGASVLLKNYEFANELSKLVIIPTDDKRKYSGSNPRLSWLQDRYGVGYNNASALISSNKYYDQFNKLLKEASSGKIGLANTRAKAMLDAVASGNLMLTDSQLSNLIDISKRLRR